MTAISLHPLAADYLERVRRAGQGVPHDRLRELLADIQAHLAEAIDPEASDAEALTLLDRLGEPEEIIAAERPDATMSEDGRGTRMWAAIFLLLLGGFVFGLGWIAGLILLWSSRAWSIMDKLIGTFVIPGGLAPYRYTAAQATCGASPSSASIATRACFASTREPARSSNSSSPGRCCATQLSARAHRPDRSSTRDEHCSLPTPLA
jgi:hypothetical protein